LAPVPVAPVNETDMVLFPEGLKALKQVANGLGHMTVDTCGKKFLLTFLAMK